MNPVKQNLIKAKALITNRRHWIRGRYSEGGFPGVRDGTATCFCAAGALARVLGVQKSEDMWRSSEFAVLDKASTSKFRLGIVAVNDMKGHDQVLTAFDLAIEDA